jgi:hypothetical protein
MHERDVMKISSVVKNGAHEAKQRNETDFSLRFWMLMIPMALPVVGIVAHYCETLEHSGPTGSYLAAPLLMASISAYIGLVVVLKKRGL